MKKIFLLAMLMILCATNFVDAATSIKKLPVKLSGFSNITLEISL